ncbi:hypothetical protein BJY04DRAFT_223321 [Aspergillus karnatakaensis]|uniref:uncharacterized protein n=1 Tax=Aspergillus karnatakaensis TaxID=1810916 RepID=UPI003CCD5AD0
MAPSNILPGLTPLNPRDNDQREIVAQMERLSRDAATYLPNTTTTHTPPHNTPATNIIFFTVSNWLLDILLHLLSLPTQHHTTPAQTLNIYRATNTLPTLQAHLGHTLAYFFHTHLPHSPACQSHTRTDLANLLSDTIGNIIHSHYTFSPLNGAIHPHQWIRAWRPVFVIHHPMWTFPQVLREMCADYEDGYLSDEGLRAMYRVQMSYRAIRNRYEWCLQQARETGVEEPVVVHWMDVLQFQDSVRKDQDQDQGQGHGQGQDQGQDDGQDQNDNHDQDQGLMKVDSDEEPRSQPQPQPQPQAREQSEEQHQHRHQHQHQRPNTTKGTLLKNLCAKLGLVPDLVRVHEIETFDEDTGLYGLEDIWDIDDPHGAFELCLREARKVWNRDFGVDLAGQIQDCVRRAMGDFRFLVERKWVG